MKPVLPVARPARPAPVRIANDTDLVGVVQAFLPARLVMTAAGAGLFEPIARAARTAEEVARAARTEPRATEIVLDGLVGLGLVMKRAGRYRATALARDALTLGGARSRVTSIALASQTWAGWDALPEILRTGKAPARPTGHRHWRGDKAANRNFIRAMYEMGWTNAQMVADALATRGARRIADVGGGPGHYALALLDRNPELRATLVDLPLTLDVAREIVKKHKMTRRFEFVASDVYKDRTLPLPRDAFDLALVSNLVHMHGEAANRRLMARLAHALAPGGRIVIHEFGLDETRTRPQRSAVFSVQMLAVTDGGRLYTYREMAGWLRDAGLRPKLLAKEPFLIEGLRPKAARIKKAAKSPRGGPRRAA